MSLIDKLKEDEKSEHAQRSDNWFKFKEGKNSIRILTEPIAIYEDYKLGMCYTDCGFKGSIKYMAYVIDNADGMIKTMKIPYGIFQYIANLETDEDWSFEGFPMPYDLNIQATGAGQKEVKYDVKPRPQRTDVSEVVMNTLSKKKTIPELIVMFKQRNKEKHLADGTFNSLGAKKEVKEEKNYMPTAIEYPEEEIDPADIPF